jgi:copper(I)-binding protein
VPLIARRGRTAIARLGALATATLVVVAACSSSGGGSGATAPTVSGAWVRVPMNAAGPAAAYLRIANTGSGADALVSVSSPAADAVELHESMMGDDGSMGMRPIDELAIPAGGSVELKPGGAHLMLIGLTSPLAAGRTVQLRLTFKSGAAVDVTAEVRAG